LATSLRLRFLISGKIPALETSRLNRRKADSMCSLSPTITWVIISPTKLTSSMDMQAVHYKKKTDFLSDLKTLGNFFVSKA
jgi:hypothetical protein